MEPNYPRVPLAYRRFRCLDSEEVQEDGLQGAHEVVSFGAHECPDSGQVPEGGLATAQEVVPGFEPERGGAGSLHGAWQCAACPQHRELGRGAEVRGQDGSDDGCKS